MNPDAITLDRTLVATWDDGAQALVSMWSDGRVEVARRIPGGRWGPPAEAVVVDAETERTDLPGLATP